MLNVGADTELRGGKIRALDLRARRSQSAVIVLVGRDRTAVAEKARFLECLCECDIGADALALPLLIVVGDELLR